MFKSIHCVCACVCVRVYREYILHLGNSFDRAGWLLILPLGSFSKITFTSEVSEPMYIFYYLPTVILRSTFINGEITRACLWSHCVH